MVKKITENGHLAGGNHLQNKVKIPNIPTFSFSGLVHICHTYALFLAGVMH